MSALFGGYGLPLNGLLPAALCGSNAPTYALGDENTRPPAGPGEEQPLPPAEVTDDDGMIKARSAAGGRRHGGARAPPAGWPETKRSRRGSDVASRARPRTGHRRPHLVRRGVRPRARLRALVLRGARARGGPGPFAFRARADMTHRLHAVRGRHPPRRLGGVQAHRGRQRRLVVPHAGPRRGRGASHGGGPRAGTPSAAACAPAAALRRLPPHLAQLEAVRFLLDERGAEVNQQDRELGWTPLHRAARMCVPLMLCLSPRGAAQWR